MSASGHDVSTANVTRFGRNVYLKEDPNTRIGGALIADRGLAMDENCSIFTDFLQKAASTAVLPWTVTKTGTDETADYVANAVDGILRFTCGGTSEAQTMRVDHGDQLMINVSKQPRFECKIKPAPAGANYGTTTRLVVGLASAYNATLDNVVTNAWFRLGDHADLNIYCEADDGTTDTDDSDTGADWVAATDLALMVAIDSALVAHFYVNGTEVKTASLAALAANTAVQPIIAFQRASGTVLDVVNIDWIKVTWKRS
jgi:hypothetical protein